MSAEFVLKYASILHIVISAAVLVALCSRRALQDFPALSVLLLTNIVSEGASLAALFFRRACHLPIATAYHLLYWSGWVADLLSFILVILVIYGVFAEAMRPFPGLQRVGRIVFRWVGAASFAVAIALAAGPQVFVKNASAWSVIQELVSRLLQGVNVLILCLLIFVCFAIRPLGLTFRSRIFGITLGLAICSMVQLIQAAWSVTVGFTSFYSPIFAFGTFGGCVAVSVWFTYFAMPQPERRMILLPTTSPFFLWNRISEILGDAPGQVAVAGFTPDMLAPG